MGVTVSGVAVDMAKMIKWKNGIVSRLTGGIAFLVKKNGIEVMRGEAAFSSDRSLTVSGESGTTEVSFEQAVIATGSLLMPLDGFAVDGDTVIGSREALDLTAIPERLVVVGGGYIGLELGSVYAKLGSKVAVVEFLPTLAPSLAAEVGPLLEQRV